MTITHHLDDATLMSFAAGSLPNALSAVAAAHVAMCARCQRELKLLEEIGGALISDLAPVPLHRPQPLPPESAGAPRPRREGAGEIPGPLAGLIPDGLDQIRWHWIGPGLWHHALKISGGGNLQLIKASPNSSVPEHGHGGSEITLVLRGALMDSTGRYERGDVTDFDESVEHTPVADSAMGCICVVANESPTRFRGLLARLFQPWHGL